MEWESRAIVLRVRPHSEHGAIVSLFSQTHGRHLGYGYGRKARNAPVGSFVHAHWRARLPEHLGVYRLEALPSPYPGTTLGLYTLRACCELLEVLAAERTPYTALYEDTSLLLHQVSAWSAEHNEAGGVAEGFAEGFTEARLVAAYLRWEGTLLGHLGFGLALKTCALGGGAGPIRYVSPRTGRGACAPCGAPWETKLLKIPAWLADPRIELGAIGLPLDKTDILEGFRLTTYFMEHAGHRLGVRLPRFRDEFVRTALITGGQGEHTHYGTWAKRVAQQPGGTPS